MAGNYPSNISAIIGSNCLGGNCHSGPSPVNTQLDLSTWDAMIKGSVYFNEVIPFNAVKSHFFGHINTNANLAPVIDPTMPLARDPLSQSDQIAMFNWIIQGAKSAGGKIPYSEVTKKIFITNSGEDMISVIDGESKRVIRLPYIGANYQPTAIAMMPDMKSYVIGMEGIGGSIIKYDAANYTNLGEFTSNLTPADIALTSDGKKGYITNNTNQGNSFGVFDPIAMKLTKTISSPLISEPLSAAISADGKYAYICGKRSDNVIRIDVSNDSVIGCLVLGADVPVPVTPTYGGKYNPQKVVLSSDSKKMYVTCLNTSEVVVFDLVKDSIIARIPTPGLPLGAAITPDGSELWATLYGSNAIDVISTTTNQVITKIDSVSQYPDAIIFTPDGNYAFIACELSAGGVHHHITGGLPPSSYVVIDTKGRKILSIQELPAISVGIVAGYKN
ncbi:MAG: hypothetical protein ACHQM6_02640 [Candidatus Kapaibacterium sp.]